MKHKQKETSRKAYIRLLASPSREPSQDDRELVRELIDEGLLKGTSVSDSDGNCFAARILGSTVKGRLFLEDLNKQDLESRPLRKLFNALLPFIGFISGLLTSLIVLWVENKMNP